MQNYFFDYFSKPIPKILYKSAKRPLRFKMVFWGEMAYPKIIYKTVVRTRGGSSFKEVIFITKFNFGDLRFQNS